MFEGERVNLRSIELTDLDDIMECINDLEQRKFLSYVIPYSRNEEEDWIRNTWERRKKGTGYIFAIEDKETKQFIGTCGFVKINNIHRSAELGISIYCKRNWGKGYGTDTMRVLLSFGFQYLNLNRIELQVVSFNERGIKFWKLWDKYYRIL